MLRSCCAGEVNVLKFRSNCCYYVVLLPIAIDVKRIDQRQGVIRFQKKLVLIFGKGIPSCLTNQFDSQSGMSGGQ